MRKRLGFEKTVTGYGLTESSGIATMCRHDDDPEIIANTSGRAIDDVEVRIVNPAGQEMPSGEPGEIVVRGYNVMKGYLNDPVKTAETIDADGWLHTGDIGVMDTEGNIDITDRVKDMFINGGFNAYPAEIENLMMNHPGVAQVAVGRRARRTTRRSRLCLCGARGWIRTRRRSANRLVPRRDGQLQSPATHRIR